MPFKSKDKDADAIKTTQKINDIIEGWIKENPAQWFWVHDRWDIKNKIRSKNAKSKNN
jgi:KDO2-lipid IV(A) lauroyltransferase